MPLAPLIFHQINGVEVEAIDLEYVLALARSFERMDAHRLQGSAIQGICVSVNQSKFEARPFHGHFSPECQRIISRKRAGRSSTGAAAYRAGEQVIDERTGEVHDYSRKRGVEHAEIVMPSATDWRPTRAEL